MRCGASLGRKNMSDNSLLIYHKTYAAGEQAERLLNSICLPHGSIHVTKQDEWQLVLLSEVPMRVLIVGAYSNHFCPQILERLI